MQATVLSQSVTTASVRPFQNGDISLLGIEMLYHVWKLGTKATDGAVMDAIVAVTGQTFHRQNFRRGLEILERRGYLARFSCHIQTLGRPAYRRFVLTPEGIGILKRYRLVLLNLVERIGQIS